MHCRGHFGSHRSQRIALGHLRGCPFGHLHGDGLRPTLSDMRDEGGELRVHVRLAVGMGTVPPWYIITERPKQLNFTHKLQ